MGIHVSLPRVFMPPTIRDEVKCMFAHALVMLRYLSRLDIVRDLTFDYLRVDGFKIAGRHMNYSSLYFDIDNELGSESDGKDFLDKFLDSAFKKVSGFKYRRLIFTLYWLGKVFDRRVKGYIKVRYYGTPGVKENGHIETDVIFVEGMRDVILGDMIASHVAKDRDLAKKLAVVLGRLLKANYIGVSVSDLKEYLGYARMRKIAIAYDDAPMTRISSRYGMALLSTESVPKEVYESLKVMINKSEVSKEVVSVYKVMDIIKIRRLTPVLMELPDELVRISRKCNIIHASTGSFIVINDKPLTNFVTEITKHYYDKLNRIGILSRLIDVWGMLRSSKV